MAKLTNNKKSCFNKLQLKHQTFQRQKANNEERTTITYVGSYELVHEAYKEAKLLKEDKHNNLGTLEEIRELQDEGPLWNLMLIYVKIIDKDMAKATEKGPNNNVLNVRMSSCPLEMHKNYKKIWNYNLYTTMAVSGLNDMRWYFEHQYPDVFYAVMNSDSQHDGIPAHLDPANWKGEGPLPDTEDTFYLAWGKHASDLPMISNIDGLTCQWFKLYSMVKPRT